MGLQEDSRAPRGRSPVTGRFVTSMTASSASSRLTPFATETAFAGVRLRWTLRADDDVDRSAGGRGASGYVPCVRCNGILLAYRSLTTSCGRVSSRRPMNRECRRWCSPVHSTNSNCPTSTGFSQRQSTIFFAVRPAPQRPAFASGGFANGHAATARG
jgi:hypothetical protein